MERKQLYIILIALGVVVVAAGGFFWWYRNNNNSTTTNSTTKSNPLRGSSLLGNSARSSRFMGSSTQTAENGEKAADSAQSKIKEKAGEAKETVSEGLDATKNAAKSDDTSVSN